MKRSTDRVAHILPVIIPNADTAASESCADTGTDAKYTSKTIPGLQQSVTDTTAASENCAFTGRLQDI